MVVIWDSTTGIPIKTLFNPHPNGVVDMDITPDAMYLVTLSNGESVRPSLRPALPSFNTHSPQIETMRTCLALPPLACSTV